ncbi:hypothetical protein [Myroides odoratus]|uniref:hypothetical protein n=1 Tax=Myroides odoratus TaxID=256 RepID=UPI003340FE47
MKKLFMFLAVAGLATFGASCSSDDSKNDDPKQKDLVLSADKTSVKEGEAVAFTVKVDGKVEAGAELYIGTEKISSPYTFAKEGKYEVKAKKNDFKESNVVTITVKKDAEPGKELKLTLIPSKTQAIVGDVITFTAKDENGAAVAGFTVKKADGTTVTGGVFSATAAGTYKFVASKAGNIDSDAVSVVVEDKPAVGQNFLKVGNVDYAIDPSQTKLLAHTIQQNGQNYIRLYKETIEGQEISYCVFVMDVRTADFATNGTSTTGAVARFTKIVLQDPESEDVIFPGTDPEGEVNMASWILSEAGEVDFEAGDVTLFDVTLTGFADGGTTKIGAGNAEGSASYDGVFASMYSIDTTNSNSTVVKTKTVKTGNVKLMNLKKLAK